MTELLNNYSFGEIISFVIALALAIKSFISFWDWAVDRVKKALHKQNQKDQIYQGLEEKIERSDQKITELTQNYEAHERNLNNLIEKVSMLVDSDKEAIKYYITREHHYHCYRLKWIDDYSLDCLERRFAHYQKEGGNSFVEDLMEDLRNLPKKPPQDMEDNNEEEKKEEK